MNDFDVDDLVTICCLLMALFVFFFVPF